MRPDEVQELCERGQEQLMAMDYLRARQTLESAEAAAWDLRDWDTLARLYMPLQEVHRQIRQTCGEGMVVLDLWAASPGERIDAEEILKKYPQGQLLMAGWESIEPALAVRRLARQRSLYVETFLAWSHATEQGVSIVMAPTADASAYPLPEYKAEEIPKGARKGNSQTYALVMGWWENLHRPFLEAADKENDPVAKMEKYRKTIEVDYACELAHQKLADAARELARVAR